MKLLENNIDFMYSVEKIEQIQAHIKNLFPDEEAFLGKLSETVLSFLARQEDVIAVERKFIQIQIELVSKNLPYMQQEFFDKYIAYCQCFYSLLSSTMLFVKKSKNIRKDHISTGRSTKKFLDSCHSLGIIDDKTFHILYQTTIVRSLVSDHIQDGLMTWGTVSMNAIFYENLPKNVAKHYSMMYTIILYPMVPFSELKKDVIQQLEKLHYTTVPMQSFVCPHFSHIAQAYFRFLEELSKEKTS